MPAKSWSGVIASTLLLAGCQQTGTAPFPTELDQVSSAGDLTVDDATSAAFSQAAANLSNASLKRHLAGDCSFGASFVSAGDVNPGLGPVFNSQSCVACHKLDGGGQPPVDGGSSSSILFRLSLAGTAADHGPLPVPGFGGQLQEQAGFGVAPEGKIETHYTAIQGSYADGTAYTLHQPTYTLTAPYQPLPAGVLMSPRLTPPVFGLGLLEAIPEASIRAAADPDDLNHDGISGRVNEVWDTNAGALRLGRFGWKANTPTLAQQVAAAYQQDMGITSPMYPNEACSGQIQAPAAGPPELSQDTFDGVVFYVQTVGVPARRAVADPVVRHGAALFGASCAGCHTPTQITGPNAADPALAYQVFHPYTDLLLHDLGPELADHRPDFLASGSEWRTPPLWGLGLRKRVTGAAPMLHDGRANGPEEAILWHGGEAAQAKATYLALSADERAALSAFLNSL